MFKDIKFIILARWIAPLVLWGYLILNLSGCNNILLIVAKFASITICIAVVLYAIVLIAKSQKSNE